MVGKQRPLQEIARRQLPPLPQCYATEFCYIIMRLKFLVMLLSVSSEFSKGKRTDEIMNSSHANVH